MNIRTALSRALIAGAAVVAIALPSAAMAHNDFSFSIGLGVPMVAPAVVAPPPVYRAPAYYYPRYGAYVPPVVTYRYSPWPYYYQYPRYQHRRDFRRDWHRRDWHRRDWDDD
jgi:hypothetical protein